MAQPTFNINELVGQVGRTPAYPFQFPSLAQQMLAARPAVPVPTKGAIQPQQPQLPVPPQPGGNLRDILIAKTPIPVAPQREV